MGILRLTLAFAVIVAHVGVFFGLRFFGGGVMAVETFYLISGFYMALILSTRYRDRLGDFYFNRFLRLFPAYWIFLGIFLLVSGGYWLWVGHPLGALAFWRAHPGGIAAAGAGFSNLTILGCDWTELYSNLVSAGAVGVDRLIAIQPVWSISIEILFYLFAPFVLRRRTRLQFLIFLGTLAIRAALWYGGGRHWTIWTYYFSPATWCFFMGGVMSYHLLAWLSQHPWFLRRARPIGYGLAAALALLIVSYDQTGWLRFQDWRYYTMVALALPFMFKAFENSTWDAALAAYSYPVYLAQGVVLSLYAPLRHYVPETAKIYWVVAFTLALATVVIRLDRKIQRRFKHRV